MGSMSAPANAVSSFYGVEVSRSAEKAPAPAMSESAADFAAWVAEVCSEDLYVEDPPVATCYGVHDGESGRYFVLITKSFSEEGMSDKSSTPRGAENALRALMSELGLRPDPGARPQWHLVARES